ncbi:hypothetical protein EV356DRAFT_323090 [Viridothelium virens]|uniref:Uncharacterized protein n=1 Tax=Viridothelium virens TaxID=1048519 RepID=A0A6A6GZ41_VIRVR|nr:hypothetical protein EV356DRAFT_323090 [Viridothelium virens]
MESSTPAGNASHAHDSTNPPSSSTSSHHPDVPPGTPPLTREQELELISPNVRASIDDNRARGVKCEYYGSVAKPWLPYPADRTDEGVFRQILAEIKQAKVVLDFSTLLGGNGENSGNGENIGNGEEENGAANGNRGDENRGSAGYLNPTTGAYMLGMF